MFDTLSLRQHSCLRSLSNTCAEYAKVEGLDDFKVRAVEFLAVLTGTKPKIDDSPLLQMDMFDILVRSQVCLYYNCNVMISDI